MDSNNVQPAGAFASSQYATDTMNADMDIDMDIDLTTADDIDAFDTEGITIPAAPAIANGATDTAAVEPQLEKVNIQGVDDLTTAQIKAYALEHFPSDQYVRIEWIDDSHANIVYQTPEAALDALRNLMQPSHGEDPVSLSDTLEKALVVRSAKPFFDNPAVDLKVRLAVTTDVKAPRAREASRFYLMNPDKDPAERRRRQQGDRRNGGGDGYNRRRFDDREQRRRRDNEAYDVDMYDDEGPSRARDQSSGRRGRRGSLSDDLMDDRRRSRRREPRSKNLDDLLPSKSDGRLRDRSASPLRDGDGRYGFEEDDTAALRRTRRRSYSPPTNRGAPGNSGKELFPERSNATKELPNPSTSSNNAKELFPGKNGHTHGKRSRELFPHKTAHSNHRRQDAYDARDFTEAAFIKPRSLEDRITGGSNGSGRSNGRLNGDDQGFNVKGSAEVGGFSIRGAADVKELFPMKTGGGNSNAGKELFSEKIKGRGGPRRKAEDMYF
ncbi:hypothetical protein B0J12DRAFT_578467 [Macrophomina phaseolina]|uniref:Nucleotide-binding alpha-beta plait n=1 Tax=Macrophomina phaseolina TaxID=35725 RepID=A0ABQ8G3G1_9PEZI|nr:hypothetical protein B0J12DRAFT_578467 [Macrophomina phaseolina]